jgi:hypothetical protein
MAQWQIQISDFLGGLAPKYYSEGYPSYGNKNMAGSMLNCDLTEPGGMKQGIGLSTLTAGTQAGAVTTLINSIIDYAVTTGVTFGIGGAKLYKITPDAVTNTGAWPHTIDKGTVTGETGEDVTYYDGKLYYSYNHSGNAGDIGMFDMDATFDDDWGSTVPSGAGALQGGVPHQMIVGGDGIMYITNGRYVATWDDYLETFDPEALDLNEGTVIESIAWNADTLWIAANRPGLTGTNKNLAAIFLWDGYTDTYQTEIRIMGEVGGLHVKNGTLFTFYRDISNQGGNKIAYLNGVNVVDMANYAGGLPTYSQITDYKDFIIFNTTSLNSLWSYLTYPWQLTSPWTTTTGDDLIYAYGAGDKDLPVRFFQLADSGYTTAGALACPFGTPMISSNGSTSYKLAKFSGYDVNSNWKSLLFDLTASRSPAKLECIKINFDQLTTGARVDWRIVNNKGETIHSDIISYAKLGGVTSVTYEFNGKVLENFRIEFDWSQGSTSNTVKIKSVKVYGII